MKIDCYSDLHGLLPSAPGGDLLIIAGDLTGRDKKKEYEQFYEWLSEQDYACKVFIGGNHDQYLQDHPPVDLPTNCHYLLDNCMDFCSLRIWGSPWTQLFDGQNPKCMAFTKATKDELRPIWREITAADILITHCPPAFVLDETFDKRYAGCPYLHEKVVDLCPLLHVFGHIHECRGVTNYHGTLAVNASNLAFHNGCTRFIDEPITIYQ